jgi:hypothetical protein
MSPLFVFILLMCKDTGLGEARCLQMHTQCVLNLQSDKYYTADPGEECDLILARVVWRTIKPSKN